MDQKCAFTMKTLTMELIEDDTMKLIEDDTVELIEDDTVELIENDTAELIVKYPLMHENVVKIIELFKGCTKSANLFLKFYKAWSEKRKESIQKLEEITKTLHKTRFDCNVSKLVGASVSAAGAVTAIAGAILIPFTVGLSTPMIIAGTATGVAGGATSFGTAITEMVILKSKVTEAQEILKVDKEEFQPLSQWFVHSIQFREAVEKVMSIDSFQKLLTDIMQDNTGQNHNIDIHQYMKNIIFKILNSLGNQMPMGLTVIKSILQDPRTYPLIYEIGKMHQTSPKIFEAVTVTTKNFTRAVGGVELATSVGSGAGSVIRVGGFAIETGVARALSQGVLAGIGLALDITSLVFTSIDVHKGSKCPKAEAVQDVGSVMEEELNLVTLIGLNLAELKLINV